MMTTSVDVIDFPGKQKIYHRGPPLDSGPYPAVLYFSLSGEESLNLDPYNQPAVIWANGGIRVFSLTMPGHEGAFPHSNAMKFWCESLLSGTAIIEKFLEICCEGIDFLINKGFIDPKKVAAAGLSRGAYMANLLAAKDHRVKTILGFAPLTRLDHVRGIEEVKDKHLLDPYSLEKMIPELIGKSFRFYIGNHDTLVGTDHCFSFIQSLTKQSFLENRKFPSVELIIYPSIGHKGHGTPPEIFENGAAWLRQQIVS